MFGRQLRMIEIARGIGCEADTSHHGLRFDIDHGGKGEDFIGRQTLKRPRHHCAHRARDIISKEFNPNQLPAPFKAIIEKKLAQTEEK